MKHILGAIIGVAFCAGAFGPAAQAEEQSITEISTNGRNVINFLRRKPEAPITEKEADQIERAVLADTQVDAGERILIEALLVGDSVRLDDPLSQNGDYVLSRVATPEAKQKLSAIASFELADPVLQLWAESSPESLSELLAMYADEASGHAKVHDTLYRVLEEVWSRSTWQNGYEPMENELNKWRNRCGRAAAAQWRDCQRMAYDIVIAFDGPGLGGDDTTGGVPDHFYESLKP